MTRPSFKSEISMGNVIQIGVFLVALGISWQAMDGKTDENRKALARHEAMLGEHTVRVRVLEESVARADERYTSILNYLSRIDSRLQRFEERLDQ